MSTTEIPEPSNDEEITTDELLERQRGLEARIEMVEREVESLREDFEKLDSNSVTESVINVLINDLVGDGESVDFRADPAANRFALQTIDERITTLETTVEFLQHDYAEVSE